MTTTTTAPGAAASRLRVLDSINDVAAADWDACAGADNPFLSHAFLSALEDSGSAAPRTGWQPQHLVLRDGAGAVVAAAPLYLKSHSFGEYVFDHAWADAYERAGGQYYPKLLSAVPFTPVPGPRLLARSDADAAALIGALQELGRQVSSIHVTFPHSADQQRLQAAGWLQRLGLQYHWHNQGYADFDAFLAALSSRKRKAIRRERRQVAEAGVELVRLTGGDLALGHWRAFWEFYQDTGSRKWGRPYLTWRFFELLHERMADHVLLVMARRQGRWIGGALNLIGGDALYGRNWGCIEEVPCLHFEACYYQAIDFAIASGLARVEAGAQGEHKLQRGYLPVATWSAHWIRDRNLRRAIADYLARERPMVEAEIAGLAEAASPYRHEEQD